ncbi:MAG: hypothetical protein J6X12_03570 [Paludibacteraceae bacterium]|nr:hypothetical protein [Paludibacteraceae bacterium]
MMDEIIKIFRSPEGDVYHIALSEHKEILSTNVIKALEGVHFVDIELRRLSGTQTANHKILSAIEETIASVFTQKEDIIICYYCDFINPIPRTSKNSMPPQQYRSLLFEKMFLRYIQQKNIKDIFLSVVEVNGINEKYYFHVIYRKSHSFLAKLIGSDIKEGFEK